MCMCIYERDNYKVWYIIGVIKISIYIDLKGSYVIVGLCYNV